MSSIGGYRLPLLSSLCYYKHGYGHNKNNPFFIIGSVGHSRCFRSYVVARPRLSSRHPSATATALFASPSSSSSIASTSSSSGGSKEESGREEKREDGGKISLPPKLRRIVELFAAVPDPRAKYEQLLHYGKRLSPLAPSERTQENKVDGCVSQVWVKATLARNNNNNGSSEGEGEGGESGGGELAVFFEAESDSLLTKGLAALLVEGLSGSPPSQILRIPPSFIRSLGLNQSLTPSRSNGFLNMFRLMQRKTLLLYSDYQRGGIEGDQKDRVAETLDSPTDVSAKAEASRSPSKNEDPNENTRQGRIKKRIESALHPLELEIGDVSHKHAGHAGVGPGATETHFNLKIVSPEFEGKSLVKRHRLVYDLLQEELESGLHALSIVAKTPSEVGKA